MERVGMGWFCVVARDAHAHIHTDQPVPHPQDIARFRPDLKLLISSATLDAEKFSEYFDYAPIFRWVGQGLPPSEFIHEVGTSHYSPLGHLFAGLFVLVGSALM